MTGLDNACLNNSLKNITWSFMGNKQPKKRCINFVPERKIMNQSYFHIDYSLSARALPQERGIPNESAPRVQLSDRFIFIANATLNNFS